MKKKLLSTCAAAFLATSVCADLPETEVAFPRDLGSHLSNTAYDHLNIFEYWYYAGKLESVKEQDLSYSVAVFAAEFPTPTGETITQHWAHTIVIDQEKSLLYYGQSGFDPASVTLSDEKLDLNYNNQYILKNEDNGIEQIQCTAFDPENNTELSLSLFLHPSEPVMLTNGDGVLDMPDGGNSIHFSKPDMATSGTVAIGDESYTINPVKSSSWISRQWGDFFPIEHGWDWFTVTLENEMNAMIFFHADKERNIVGGAVNISFPDGTQRSFSSDEIIYDRVNYWTSPKYGCTYPLNYIVTIPEIDLSFEIAAKFAEQEVDHMFDGIANVTGSFEGHSVNGAALMNINIIE